MGACGIVMTCDGSLNDLQVTKTFKERHLKDREEFGNDPYNGSWSTIPSIRVHGHVRKRDIYEAEEYCLQNAKKWEYAVAVKYSDEAGKEKWLLAGWACE